MSFIENEITLIYNWPKRNICKYEISAAIQFDFFCMRERSETSTRAY